VAGRTLGRGVLRRAPFRWLVRSETLDRGARWFAERQGWALFAARFLPGARLPTYVAAGVLHVPLAVFAATLLLGALVWTPLVVGVSALLGKAVLPWLEAWGSWALPVVASLALGVFLLTRGLPALATWRGRRLLLGRWRRTVRWEFWPLWLFNLPVLAHFAWLAIRYRSLTVFTAANPAIPAGGFVLESKSQILDGLEALPERVARFCRLPAALAPEERVRAALEFLGRHELDFPVVVKPDVGQRGEGVVVARDEEALARAVRGANRDLLVQEHVPGLEFGVFYVRHPEQERGRVFSVTRKLFPSVVGDGLHTLEELVLADDRAVCVAPLYLERLGEATLRVPARGERIALVEVGNHCRGAVFGNGAALVTPRLEAAIDQLSRSFAGFFFGRYDLRVESEEALRQGGPFKVLELNGVTSEATHIYEPGASLREAYRVLFAQWRAAFEIGAANLRAGAKPTPIGELVRLLVRHLDGEATPG
jgi:hypothetical protein